jgi:hypothetical protein
MERRLAARRSLERAEFDAIDAAVRYYDGSASTAEFVVALERFRELAATMERELREGAINTEPEAGEIGH